MPRASKVVKLVLLGSALGLIGWVVYNLWEDTWPSGRTHHSGYYGGGRSSFFGGGSSSGSNAAPGGSLTTRGGFGAHGAVGSGE